MELLMNPPQSLMVHVRIDLRRPDIHMAQHFLDAPQIRPAAQQVRGEAMTKRVHSHFRGHPCPEGILLHKSPDLNT